MAMINSTHPPTYRTSGARPPRCIGLLLPAFALLFVFQLTLKVNAQTVQVDRTQQLSQQQNRQAASPAQGQAATTGTQQATAAGTDASAGAKEVTAAPQDPAWPVSNKPSPATGVWDSHGLRIAANNSSLDQILHDVATDTGATVDGLSQDERIFGDYGPGPARDVLSQILDGSGYNIVMVGDLGQGTPRQILLSTRTKGGSTAAGARSKDDDDDSDSEEPEPQPEPVQEQPRPQPVANPFGGSAPPRSPQEIMQEMQQRQQQLQQQQQQQQ